MLFPLDFMGEIPYNIIDTLCTKEGVLDMIKHIVMWKFKPGTEKEMMEFIQDYEGIIPGASAVECGNYLDLNLDMAKYWARKYLKEVLERLSEERLQYPQ